MAAEPYPYGPGVKYIWIMRRFTGDKTKMIEAHAASNISYFILDRGSDKRVPFVVAAQLWTSDPPVDADVITDPALLAKLERWFRPTQHRHRPLHSKPMPNAFANSTIPQAQPAKDYQD